MRLPPMYIFVFKYLNTSFAAIPGERVRKIFRRLFTEVRRARRTEEVPAASSPTPPRPAAEEPPPRRKVSSDISASRLALLRSRRPAEEGRWKKAFTRPPLSENEKNRQGGRGREPDGCRSASSNDTRGFVNLPSITSTLIRNCSLFSE